MRTTAERVFRFRHVQNVLAWELLLLNTLSDASLSTLARYSERPMFRSDGHRRMHLALAASEAILSLLILWRAALIEVAIAHREILAAREHAVLVAWGWMLIMVFALTRYFLRPYRSELLLALYRARIADARTRSPRADPSVSSARSWPLHSIAHDATRPWQIVSALCLGPLFVAAYLDHAELLHVAMMTVTLWFGMAFVSWSSRLTRAIAASRRHRQFVSERSCIVCSYRLDGCSRVLRRCPECGLRWPLHGDVLWQDRS